MKTIRRSHLRKTRRGRCLVHQHRMKTRRSAGQILCPHCKQGYAFYTCPYCGKNVWDEPVKTKRGMVKVILNEEEKARLRKVGLDPANVRSHMDFESASRIQEKIDDQIGNIKHAKEMNDEKLNSLNPNAKEYWEKLKKIKLDEEDKK